MGEKATSADIMLKKIVNNKGITCNNGDTHVNPINTKNVANIVLKAL